MCEIVEYKYKFQQEGDQPHLCSVFHFIFTDAWIASYTDVGYSPVWQQLDVTKENIIYPQPSLKQYQVFIDFSEGIPPTVSYSFESPKFSFTIQSIQVFTSMDQTDIPSEYEDLCQTAPLVINVYRNKLWIYIISAIVGAGLLIGLVFLIIFLVKKYKK